jgi:hypothetical protein
MAPAALGCEIARCSAQIAAETAALEAELQKIVFQSESP